ncbi:MAG: DUF3445 domain-containing protein [Candidatus Nanopelagicus sp.]|nr:DUF3445 domain-containing protein [Candidatus Nanopelagicus sp.]
MSTRFIYPPPKDGKPFRLSLGLRELDPVNWIEAGSDLVEQVKQRNELLETKRNIVFQEVAGYEEAALTYARALKDNLGKFHSDYVVTGDQITHNPTGISVNLLEDHPFVQLARVIAEDLCLLSYENSTWNLVAGVVIFPSRWKLLEKIGKNIDAIHEPVPGYQGALQPLMVDTFNKIKPDRPVWRRNWSLHETEELHEPTYIPHKVEISDYWWRTERQTLTKSESNQFLLFTIRNRNEPFKWIKEDPQATTEFIKTLQSLDPQMLEYKRLAQASGGLIEFLKN